MSHSDNSPQTLHDTQESHFLAQLLALKESAGARFAQLPWPQREDENWRRSAPQLIPFDVLDDLQFYDDLTLPTSADGAHFVSWSTLLKGDLAERDEALSAVGISMSQWNSYTTIIQDSLERNFEKSELLPLINLGNATQDGVIVVKKSTEAIEIRLSGQKEENIIAPCYVIDVRANVQATIKISMRDEGFFIPSFYINLRDGARCNILYDQDVSSDAFVMSKTYVKVAKDAHFHSTALYSGSFQTADTLYSNIVGEGATVFLDGCYFANQDQLIDIRTHQEHSAPSSYSRTRYHGVVDEQGHSVFRGLIKVNNNAIYTDAYLTNKNLLLSEEGRVDSIPCLNIDTNEVKCSHGSTTSQVSPDHLFYLKSRGVTESEARALLIEGFFNALLPSDYASENDAYLQRIQLLKEGAV